MYGVVHQFTGGTKEQYEASIGAVHPSDGSLPAGQLFHAAGPSADGWTITVDDSTRPPALDKMTKGSPKGTTPSYTGRALVQGDELTICWQSGRERPNDLRGANSTAIRFRREQK